MNRVTLEAKVAERAGLTKKNVSEVLSTITQVVTEELAKGGTVRLVGFGTFTVRKRAARKGKNPKTGETLDIPASKKPVFKAGKTLTDAANV